MLLAWCAISNHCTLGSLDPAPPNDPSPGECPFHAKHSAPAKPKPASDSPCCKILRAIATSPAKSFARVFAGLCHGQLEFSRLVATAPPKVSFACATLDTGHLFDFAELILQRSILAHAPPVLVETSRGDVGRRQAPPCQSSCRVAG
jgi:hypothetical protein